MVTGPDGGYGTRRCLRGPDGGYGYRGSGYGYRGSGTGMGSGTGTGTVVQVWGRWYRYGDGGTGTGAVLRVQGPHPDPYHGVPVHHARAHHPPYPGYHTTCTPPPCTPPVHHACPTRGHQLPEQSENGKLVPKGCCQKRGPVSFRALTNMPG